MSTVAVAAELVEMKLCNYDWPIKIVKGSRLNFIRVVRLQARSNQGRGRGKYSALIWTTEQPWIRGSPVIP